MPSSTSNLQTISSLIYKNIMNAHARKSYCAPDADPSRIAAITHQRVDHGLKRSGGRQVDDLHTLIDRGWGNLDIGDRRYCLGHSDRQVCPGETTLALTRATVTTGSAPATSYATPSSIWDITMCLVWQPPLPQLSLRCRGSCSIARTICLTLRRVSSIAR